MGSRKSKWSSFYSEISYLCTQNFRDGKNSHFCKNWLTFRVSKFVFSISHFLTSTLRSLTSNLRTGISSSVSYSCLAHSLNSPSFSICRRVKSVAKYVTHDNETDARSASRTIIIFHVSEVMTLFIAPDVVLQPLLLPS